MGLTTSRTKLLGFSGTTSKHILHKVVGGRIPMKEKEDRESYFSAVNAFLMKINVPQRLLP